MAEEARAKREKCVLLFSGGRDSSLAAVRLCADLDLTLVTVTSEHLAGLDAVHRRLDELGTVVPQEVHWLCTSMPPRVVTINGGAETCLPCQLAYVLAGVQTATALGTRNVALGYAGYQSDWPEQTPYATGRLASVLHGLGISLLLPVQGVRSKVEARRELVAAGLSADSLEQKCAKQVANVSLTGDALVAAIDDWVDAVERLAPAVRDEPLRATQWRTIKRG